MKFVTAEGIRKGEGRAILRNPSLDRVMMDRAGKGLAYAIRVLARHLESPDPVIRLLAGPGNNGGDLFAAALFLEDMGLMPEVWLACPVEQIRGSAKYFFDQMVQEEIPYHEVIEDKDWGLSDVEVQPPPILVDGLLGTGARASPAGRSAGPWTTCARAGGNA